MTVTILDGMKADHVRTYPYTFAITNPALPKGYYAGLMDAYPSVEQVIGDRPVEQNARYDLDAVYLLNRDDIDPVMRDFIAAHTSFEFWLQIVYHWGDHIRRHYPGLEDQVGKPLHEWTVGVRNAKREEPVDVELDAKPGYNTPVSKKGTVRGEHVDNPHELWAALMYCRMPDDLSEGGDFWVDEAVEPVHRWKWWGKLELYREHFKPNAMCAYQANVACQFINGITAVHHVTPRDVTKHPRRLMNFVAEVRHPLFKVPKKRHEKPKGF